jgi:hypothetical protein
MGIYAWGPNGATELLVIVVRASLAAGAAFGLALVTLGPAAFLIGQAKAWVPARSTMKPTKPPMQIVQPVVRPRDYAGEERAEKERMNKIDDATTLAREFYDEHSDVLKESLPAALFKTQMHTQFPDTITPEQAWQAAQAMIADMIPLIAKSHELERAKKEEEQRKSELAKDEATKLEEATKKQLTMERLIEWRSTEEARLKEHLPPGHELTVHLLNLTQRFDDLMRETIDEAQP